MCQSRINNRYSNESAQNVKQVMVHFRPQVTNDSAISMNVKMTDVILINNSRDGVSNDIDLLYDYPDPTLILFDEASSGNFINTAFSLDEGVHEDAVLPGTDVSVNHSYTSLEFEMDGTIPLLTPDEFGVGQITFIDPVGIKSNKGNTFPLKIYSANSMLNVSGLTAGEKLEIFAITGGLFSRTTVTSSEVSMRMPQGIYIIRYKNKAEKILVQ